MAANLSGPGATRLAGNGINLQPRELQERCCPIPGGYHGRFVPAHARCLKLRWPQTVVVTYEFGKREEVQPGTRIFVAAAKKQPDGTLLTPRITYGRKGEGPAF